MKKRSKQAVADVMEDAKPGSPATAPVYEKTEEEKGYETKRHFDTLMEADEIKNDPAKMERVHKLAGRHMKAITSLQDLKDVAEAKFGGQKKKTSYIA